MSPEYKDKNQLQKRKMVIQLIFILVLILLICMAVLSSITAKNKEKELAISSGKFQSVKDILEYFGCEYKGEKESTLEGFVKDINTIFKYDLYEEEKSNEKFYHNIIEKIAQFLNYKSFRLIDNSKKEKIEIQVIAKNGKIDKIIINGIEDYFIYMDSQISLKKYKELEITDVSIEAPELIECIQSNWSVDCNFGTKESIFQNYDIYFDEGIEVRRIDGKIYNVVFTDKYEKQVVNGFTVGTKSDIIKSKLGTPTFQNSDGSIIGYKSKNVYVFFENKQISVYRNTTEMGFDQFFKLVDEFLLQNNSLLEFMNELTYLWPDYDEYTYDAETVFLSYPNKGIDIKINYDNTDGIVLYNNIGVSQEVVNKYLEHTEFVALLQVDNVYRAEERRVEKKNQLSQKCKEYQEEYEKEDTRNRGNIYSYYAELDSNEKIKKMCFVAQDSNFVNCEMIESIDTYVWLNEYCFVYSNEGKGIYYYDLKNQVKGKMITGEEEFKIESYENGILKYDDQQMQVQY